MRRRLIAACAAAGLALGAAGHVSAAAAGGYAYVGEIANPAAVATAPEGGAYDGTARYIADQGANRVLRVADNGAVAVLNDTYAWGSPRDLDVDPDGGGLWVIDALANKLVQLDRSGAVGLQVGGGGLFKAAEGVAVDRSRVYVADTYHNRIAAFSKSGSPLWSATSCGGVALSRVRDVTVGPGGRVYGTDTDRNRIVVLDPATGSCLSSFGSAGRGNGQFRQPRAIAWDGADGVWVTEGGSNRLQHLSASGTFIAKTGGPGAGDGQFTSPHCVFVDGARVDVCDTFTYRLQRFDVSPSGIPTYADTLLRTPPSPDGFAGAESVAYGPDGSQYAVDIGNLRVLKYAPDGSFVTNVGGNGTGPGQFQFLRGVTVRQSDGSVVVTDSENSRLQVFDADLRFVRIVKPTNTKLLRPHYAVLLPDGTFWVTDTYNNRVVHLAADGQLLSAFTGNGWLVKPQGLALDTAGALYVSNSGRNTIEKYDASGRLLMTLATAGAGPRQVRAPNGLALVSEGGEQRLYVADTGNDRIVVLTAAGAAVATFGSPGSGGAGLDTPRGVALDPTSGEIAVADYANNRLAIWTH